MQKRAIMTRGLAEISRLGVAMGANPLTFIGLSGVGDLVVTCTSVQFQKLARRRLAGQGQPLEGASQYREWLLKVSILSSSDGTSPNDGNRNAHHSNNL